MYLAKRKVKGKSIDHPLAKIVVPVDQEKLNSLLEQLRAGNKYIIDEILNCHIRLAISIASQYALFMPSKSHDLVSEAMLSIINCCNNINKLIDNNITSFIVSRIHCRLSKFIKEDNVIRIPASSFSRDKQIKYIPINDECRSYNHNRLIDLQEMIDLSIKTDEERRIINLRSQSYRDREIAEMIGLSDSRVGQIRMSVYKRFRRLENGS